MSGPSQPRCALGRLVPAAPTSTAELFAMRQRAWREQGLAILPLDQINDDWTRQAITNEAVRLYGPANGRAG
ncbi:MAG: hypothetical protein INR68_05515 [Methylobacterium mesophilicum]|nr:hypothetical protein [Methylobacterium mesophilicum]